MNKTKLGSVIVALIAFFDFAAGQASKVAAEQRALDASGRFSFAVPGGWKSSSNDRGFAVVDPGGKILIAVTGHNYRDFEAFAADANLERDGLTLVGNPQAIQNGKTFRAVKSTPQGRLIVDTSVLFSPHGDGVLIAAFASEADANTGFDAGLKIASSVQFIKVQASAGSGPSDSALSGKHLLYLYTASGYSERKDIYLCKSGGFFQSTGMGGFTPNDANGGSFGASSGKHGTWRVSGSSLILTFNNGAVAEYAISKRPASNEIGLSGKQYFVQDQNVCN